MCTRRTRMLCALNTGTGTTNCCGRLYTDVARFPKQYSRERQRKGGLFKRTFSEHTTEASCCFAAVNFKKKKKKILLLRGRHEIRGPRHSTHWCGCLHTNGACAQGFVHKNRRRSKRCKWVERFSPAGLRDCDHGHAKEKKNVAVYVCVARALYENKKQNFREREGESLHRGSVECK